MDAPAMRIQSKIHIFHCDKKHLVGSSSGKLTTSRCFPLLSFADRAGSFTPSWTFWRWVGGFRSSHRPQKAERFVSQISPKHLVIVDLPIKPCDFPYSYVKFTRGYLFLLSGQISMWFQHSWHLLTIRTLSSVPYAGEQIRLAIKVPKGDRMGDGILFFQISSHICSRICGVKYLMKRVS